MHVTTVAYMRQRVEVSEIRGMCTVDSMIQPVFVSEFLEIRKIIAHFNVKELEPWWRCNDPEKSH